jgi:hypothetical protein
MSSASRPRPCGCCSRAFRLLRISDWHVSSRTRSTHEIGLKLCNTLDSSETAIEGHCTSFSNRSCCCDRRWRFCRARSWCTCRLSRSSCYMCHWNLGCRRCIDRWACHPARSIVLGHSAVVLRWRGCDIMSGMSWWSLVFTSGGDEVTNML